ncbi:hypothetical protein [Chroococcus sp. FPU101]|uniref:hypothetical protein n=1 Tax=Chroococcus sp. FPU101 TaxID=1974212 RepID=UPI001A8CB503|nr:hypothetical protein [Chroococcus sp. FPU101]GFE69038.1 hypothetical protein CFPU101_16480 [Chroococcus sp. FPU101]
MITLQNNGNGHYQQIETIFKESSSKKIQMTLKFEAEPKSYLFTKHLKIEEALKLMNKQYISQIRTKWKYRFYNLFLEVKAEDPVLNLIKETESLISYWKVKHNYLILNYYNIPDQLFNNCVTLQWKNSELQPVLDATLALSTLKNFYQTNSSIPFF